VTRQLDEHYKTLARRNATTTTTQHPATERDQTGSTQQQAARHVSETSDSEDSSGSSSGSSGSSTEEDAGKGGGRGDRVMSMMDEIGGGGGRGASKKGGKRATATARGARGARIPSPPTPAAAAAAVGAVPPRGVGRPIPKRRKLSPRKNGRGKKAGETTTSSDEGEDEDQEEDSSSEEEAGGTSSGVGGVGGVSRPVGVIRHRSTTQGVRRAEVPGGAVTPHSRKRSQWGARRESESDEEVAAAPAIAPRGAGVRRGARTPAAGSSGGGGGGGVGGPSHGGVPSVFPPCEPGEILIVKSSLKVKSTHTKKHRVMLFHPVQQDLLLTAGNY